MCAVFALAAAPWAKLLLSTINKMNCFVSVWSTMTAVIFGLAAYSGAWHQYLLGRWGGWTMLHSSGIVQAKQRFNEFPLNEPRSASYLKAMISICLVSEEGPQGGNPVRGSLPPVPPGHRRLWWRGHRVGRGFWADAVPLRQPLSSWAATHRRWFQTLNV